MKLHKVKYRNPALDTVGCYCINNYLWAKDKVQIINNGKAFLAPKLYCPRHVSQLAARKLADAKYRASQPLKQIKSEHERKKREFKRRKRQKTSNRIYKFAVNVSYDEYKLLWNFLYKDIRNPITDRVRIQTIEELDEKRKKKLGENE